MPRPRSSTPTVAENTQLKLPETDAPLPTPEVVAVPKKRSRLRKNSKAVTPNRCAELDLDELKIESNNAHIRLLLELVKRIRKNVDIRSNQSASLKNQYLELANVSSRQTLPDSGHAQEASEHINSDLEEILQTLTSKALISPSRTNQIRVAVLAFLVESQRVALQALQPAAQDSKELQSEKDMTNLLEVTNGEIPALRLLLKQVESLVENGGFTSPEVLDQVLQSASFDFVTSQEVDALQVAACSGRLGINWEVDERRGIIIHRKQRASHYVELRADAIELSAPQEIASTEAELPLYSPTSLAMLESLSLSQDADFAYTLLYIARTLAPPVPLPVGDYIGGWISLDDVMEKIGWYPAKRSVEERAELRTRVWNYIQFGERARVVGQRSGTYRDPYTGKEISTRIESAPWRVHDTEIALNAKPNDAPLRVELVIGKQWEPLLSNARLAQYLPMGDVVATLPAQQTAGEWARCIALVLARQWRMRPRELDKGQLRLTRRELLTHYLPRNQTVEDILNSPNPKRAVEYWRTALQMLTEVHFLAPQAEAKRSVAEMLQPFGRQAWKDKWLDEAVELHPGSGMSEALRQRVESLPTLKPRDLKRPKKRQRRKVASTENSRDEPPVSPP